jgi:hypothetical protein
MELWQKKASPGITVEAIRLNEENIDEVAAWCRAEVIEEIDPEHPQEKQKGLNVDTAAGMKRASLGMYVVKFGRHFFVSHNRPFEVVYEPVERPAPPLESAGDSRKARGFADPFDRGRMGP